MDNIDILISCLRILKQTSGSSIYKDTIKQDIDEMIIKILTQLSLHYGEVPSPDLYSQLQQIKKEDGEYTEFIKTSLPLIWIMWNMYQGANGIDANGIDAN